MVETDTQGIRLLTDEELSKFLLIEFACTANKGRSPVAERIAQNYLDSLGETAYAAISSGSHWDAIKDGELSVGFMAQVINLALERTDLNVYSKKDQTNLNHALEQENVRLIETFYNMAGVTFQKEEQTHRAEALKYFGIEGKVKEESDQTIVRPTVVGLFPMAEINLVKIQEIYAPSEYKPKFMQSLDISNAFGKGKDEYFAVIEELLGEVPKKVDLVLN